MNKRKDLKQKEMLQSVAIRSGLMRKVKPELHEKNHFKSGASILMGISPTQRIDDKPPSQLLNQAISDHRLR